MIETSQSCHSNEEVYVSYHANGQKVRSNLAYKATAVVSSWWPETCLAESSRLSLPAELIHKSIDIGMSSSTFV